MPFHHVGVYDAFHSVAEAKEHYRRARTIKCFKLDKQVVKKLDPGCTHCGKKFSEHNRTANSWADEGSDLRFEFDEDTMLANHCWYHPLSKRVIIMQYHCSWESALEVAFRRTERLY